MVFTGLAVQVVISNKLGRARPCAPPDLWSARPKGCTRHPYPFKSRIVFPCITPLVVIMQEYIPSARADPSGVSQPYSNSPVLHSSIMKTKGNVN